MVLAVACEDTAYSLLLMLTGVILADPKLMLASLVRGCIALAFTTCVPAVACSHESVKGSELSYMTLALQREPTANRSLLMRLGAVLADPPGPMLARLVRGCIALAFTASVPADQSSPALLIPSRAANSATWYWRLHASTTRTARY